MKGIIFSEPMFRATIEGRKTQIRLIVKPKPNTCGCCYSYKDSDYGYIGGGKFCYTKCIKVYKLYDSCNRYEECIKPRYKVGEKVYLKEPYYAEYGCVCYEYAPNFAGKRDIVFKNKLFMPAKYARYFIEITDVRCELLKDITTEDIRKEGFQRKDITGICGVDIPSALEMIEAYAALFDKINGKGTWESNPYVWVYTFKLIDHE